MAKEIDAYREWLGITETARPLDHYQLLRLKRFEDDLAKIREHYTKMNAHVRKYATGEYAAQSQNLLNELARAMLCLTDVKRKREYDASLGRTDSGEGRRRTFAEVLLAGKLITQDQLDKARGFAEATGLEVRDALLQQKLVKPEAVAAAYAESVGLPYLELAEIGANADLAAKVPPRVARQHSCIPVMADEGHVLIASPRPLAPEVEDDLRLRFGMPVRTVLCTAGAVSGLIPKFYSAEAGAEAAPAGRKQGSRKTAASRDGEGGEKRSLLRPASELSEDERVRRRIMFAVIAFNIAVVVCMIAFVTLRGGMGLLGLVDFFVTLLAAAIVGAGTFFVATSMKL